MKATAPVGHCTPARSVPYSSPAPAATATPASTPPAGTARGTTRGAVERGNRREQRLELTHPTHRIGIAETPHNRSPLAASPRVAERGQRRRNGYRGGTQRTTSPRASRYALRRANCAINSERGQA